MKIVHTEDFSDIRAAMYPPITDLADALYWQAKGDDTKMHRYLAACEAVKLAVVKPSN